VCGYFAKVIATLEVKDIVTFVIAIYGAFLSTFNLRQALNKERRQIFVTYTPAFLAYGDGNTSTQMTSIDIVNHGYRPVVAVAPTVRMPNGENMSFVGVPDFRNFPRKLEDGESVSMMIPNDEVAKVLRANGYSGKVKLWPNCKDRTGKRYWSKKWIFDLATDGGKST
jgi:hypothetical protein